MSGEVEARPSPGAASRPRFVTCSICAALTEDPARHAVWHVSIGNVRA